MPNIYQILFIMFYHPNFYVLVGWLLTLFNKKFFLQIITDQMHCKSVGMTKFLLAVLRQIADLSILTQNDFYKFTEVLIPYTGLQKDIQQIVCIYLKLLL
jgi:hypothetical protein